jgi:haloalkane dehalogenase
VALSRCDGIAYREAVPPGWSGEGPAALLLHGYPESSYVWRSVLPAVAAAGYRAVAPDLPGFGDSAADLPGTWERQVEAVERFRRGLELHRVALVVHDWGGLIGLRWACDHPSAVAALVLSSTGFFPDGRWHSLARALRTEGEGERLVENMSRETFGHALRGVSAGMADDAIEEFWKAYADADRRRSQLDLYRSGDFSKLEPYSGKLGELGVPALIIWGAKDLFAPVTGAHRFAREIPDSRVVVLASAGHFIQEDDPERFAAEVRRFLAEVRDRDPGR